jgi:hypothetical protein
MSNSKLLKEAIADAKAVRETAIANAKIALEEAFTPRLQSILSQKLQQEMEDEEEADVNEEYSDGSEAPTEDASDIGDADNKQPADDANSSSDLAQGNPDTDVETAEVGLEPEEAEKATVSEGEEEDEDSIEEGEYNADGEEEIVAEEEDEDELDLEAIIRELEEELDDEEEEEVEDIASDVVDSHEYEMHDEESEEEVEEGYHEEDEMDMDSEGDDEEIDLDEILREMGYGEEEDSEEMNEEEDEDKVEELEKDLEEAYSTIKSLKKTINEVNLLNAKLLYTNKLFRSYELTNEQKHKVVETLDRTGNVREVKLVFSTLAESFKFTGTTKKQKATKINESFASKSVASTAPKKVITESTNLMAERFKKLANIN